MDNYAEFLERLDKAAASLKKRQAKLNHALLVVSYAATQNRFGYAEWATRHEKLEDLLAGKDVANTAALTDLHAISTNMVSVFQGRAERVTARLAAVQGRVDEINKSLNALERSKQKLTSSRKVAEERENLNKAMLGLAGTAEGIAGATPDGGLGDDLKSAREAVLMAEALLEVKGI